MDQKSSFSQIMNEDIIESAVFLNDKYVKSFLEKVISLGFSLDAVKETFKIYLKLNNIDLNSIYMQQQQQPDLSKVIDEEKFLEQLIFYSMQHDPTVSPGGVSQLDDDENNAADDDDPATNLDLEGSASVKSTAAAASGGNEMKLLQMGNHMNASRGATIIKQLNTTTALRLENQNKKAQAIQKYQQEQTEIFAQSINRLNDKSNLKQIIIDGNDLALSSDKQNFNIQKIKLAFDFFDKRNHNVKVILPLYRVQLVSNPSSKLLIANNNTQQQQQQQQQGSSGDNAQSPASRLADQQFLQELEARKQLFCTPYKQVGSKRISFNDDLYLLKLAVATPNSIIVSNDQFKKYMSNEQFKHVIEERMLMYSIIDNIFLPVEDPLGPNGPSLDNFLRIEPIINPQYMKRCPYKKKCTFGPKCKFFHPERGLNQDPQSYKTAHQSVLDQVQLEKQKLEEFINKHQNQPPMQPISAPTSNGNNVSANLLKSVSPNSFVDTFANVEKQFSITLNSTAKSNQQMPSFSSHMESMGSNMLRSMGVNQHFLNKKSASGPAVVSNTQQSFNSFNTFANSIWNENESLNQKLVNMSSGLFNLDSSDLIGKSAQASLVSDFSMISLNPKVASSSSSSSSPPPSVTTSSTQQQQQQPPIKPPPIQQPIKSKPAQVESVVTPKQPANATTITSTTTANAKNGSKQEESRDDIKVRLLKLYDEKRVNDLLDKYKTINNYKQLVFLANSVEDDI